MRHSQRDGKNMYDKTQIKKGRDSLRIVDALWTRVTDESFSY